MIPMAILIEAASKVCLVDLAEIKGNRRARELAYIRFAISHIAKEQGFSFPRIGQGLGMKDASSIRHAVVQAENLLGRDATFAEMVSDISKVAAAMHQTHRKNLLSAISNLALAA